MSGLNFEINLSGNFATALEHSNKGLGETGEGAKKATKELSLFEGEVGGLSTSLGGLELNFSALAKGGSIFTFDLAEGLRSVVELGSKVVETFIDIGKEAVGVAGKTQDIDLAIKLNVGDDKAEKLNKLAEVYGEKSRFSAEQMKESWLPLLRQGIGDTDLIDTVSTIATDMAAKSGGGIGQVRQTIDAFASVFQRGKLKEAGLEQMGLQADTFFDEVGKQMGMTRDAARKAARAGKLNAPELARLAATMVAERQGGGLADPTKAAAANLGGTLERLNNLKESMFAGISDSQGMKDLQGFLDNLIKTVKGPAGKELFAELGEGFHTIFGDLSGDDGLKKIQDGFRGLADTAKDFFHDFKEAWPGIKQGFADALPIVENLLGVLGKTLEIMLAIPRLGGDLGDKHAQAGVDMATGTVSRTDAGGGWSLALDEQDRKAALKRAGKGGFFHSLFSSNDTLNREALQQIDVDKGPWEKVDLSGGATQSIDPLMSKVPAYAAGGIVDSPTLALIGEAGPEAIVPLSSSRGSLSDLLEAGGASSLGRQVAFSGDIVVNVHGVEGGAEEFGARAAQIVRVEFKRFLDELPV